MDCVHTSGLRPVCRHRLAIRLIVGAVVLCAFAIATDARGADDEPIPWRSAPARTSAYGAPDLRLTEITEPRRVVLRLHRLPTDGERAALQAAGVTLLSPLGSKSFFVTIDPLRLNHDALASNQLIANFKAIDPYVKLHPAFHNQAPRGLKPAALLAAAPADPRAPDILATYVMFHRDVDLTREALPLMLLYGGAVRDSLQSVNALVVELPRDVIHDLATEDIVQWIEPALPRFSTTNDSSRTLVQADRAQAPPYNLDGAGVSVMVYDGGTARETHVDFGGRLTVRDAAGVSDHATHVAGIIGGSGVAGGGVYAGMAPAVTMEAYGFEWDAGGVFLYNNPGDLESDYDDAINNRGVDIANNSIGSNTALNWDCEITGDYGVTSALIDAIVRGSLGSGEPFRIVWAAGNERQTDRCGETWNTTAPPAGAKNHIAVGAVNSNDDSMTSFSSWGPVDDGRLKPDIVAPGCQSDGDGGVTSCSADSDTAYATKCGTSMAAPVVTGLCALLLQDYRVQFPAAPDPRNSTLKVLLAHAALDLGAPGPDYQFGYGSVRIADTIDLMRQGSFAEATVDHGETLEFETLVEPGDSLLKATLAWDDPPATPNVTPALVNDLDLRVYDPSWSRWYPWTLDPANPDQPAVRTREDHVNNIEQVLVEDATPGVWRVEVSGRSVPEGPQAFSLVASPGLEVASPPNCPGDLDHDLDVDLNDLGQFLTNYGMSAGATYGQGDLDGDGDIDLGDLAALLAAFGQDCP